MLNEFKLIGTVGRIDNRERLLTVNVVGWEKMAGQWQKKTGERCVKWLTSNKVIDKMISGDLVYLGGTIEEANALIVKSADILKTKFFPRNDDPFFPEVGSEE